ncbi:restriction endonuclease subunit S [Planktothrix sp. FACHB-1365]|uniref:restriction endonuclease subunit S n=1 Tax=Planktothrix sp. FACHB-1365 TaxID=2692855 RepID=UPI00168803B1|nr:restriction endonuclease subunit S [Planktothrix sp. FACHB-1365]MBD2483488.1 restriction endonuclease subunit S [Planktothrix sp. FACHB-1365]
MESKINYVSLNEICTIQTGKKDANYGDKGGEYPFFTCADKPILSPTYSFDGESIILPGNGANVGMVFYHVGKFEAYQRTYVLNNIKCNSRYLFHHLSAYWKKFNLSKQFGSATNYIRMQNFLDYTIPLPPIASQRRIADILDKADEIIRKRKEAIALTEQLQKSIFLDMFGDPVINPKGWEVKRLEDVTTKITDGVHAKPEYTATGIPFISVKDITTGELLFDNCKFISEESHFKYTRRYKPEYGDILYTKVGATYGRPALVNVQKEFSIYVSVALLKPNREIIKSEFLKEVMATSAVKSQADKSIKGIGVPDLHLNMIKNFLIPVPSISIQDEFIKKFKKINQQKIKLELHLQESENLFNSLLQKAFKGEL